MQEQNNSSSCLAVVVAPLFIVVALIMIAAGWAIDNGYLTTEALASGAGEVVNEVFSTPNVLVVPNSSQNGQVVIPNGSQGGQLVVPNGNAPLFPLPSGVSSGLPTQVAGVIPTNPPPPTATMTPILTVSAENAAVITVTATLEPVITVTATLPPVITATPEPVVVVTATPISPPTWDPASGCTTAGSGISCGTPPTLTPVPPTMLPNNHGFGGDVPLGPTPEVVEVQPHEEVTPPPVEVFIIKAVEGWGDVTVRSTFNGQQAGHVCYSSKYDGQVMTCPPPDLLSQWKETHEVEVRR